MSLYLERFQRHVLKMCNFLAHPVISHYWWCKREWGEMAIETLGQNGNKNVCLGMSVSASLNFTSIVIQTVPGSIHTAWREAYATVDWSGGGGVNWV